MATSSSRRNPDSFSGGPIVRSGYLKMLKNLRKQYFVLRDEAPGNPPCLEYYKTEKKFQNKKKPKGSISLNDCIYINKFIDTEKEHVIALFTKDESFYVVLETESELIDWINSMLLLKNVDQMNSNHPRLRFGHMWEVNIEEQELCKNAGMDIQGPYRLFLNDKVLGIVKKGQDIETDSIQFSLIFIKRFGYKDRNLLLEMGNMTITGPGEFWIQVKNNSIAISIYNLILTTMQNLKRENF